jgi:glycosyltransferase involved in cell wall biosynthesis
VSESRLVCHVTTAHPARDARIFHKQCLTLARDARYRVVLIAQSDRPETGDGVRIEPLPRAAGKLQRITRLQPRALLAARRQRAALYHFHDPELIPMALLMRLLWGRRVVYDMHELYSEALFAGHRRTRSPLRPLLRMALESLPLRFFDLVVFPTESLRREIACPAPGVTLVNLPTIAERRAGAAPPWEEREHDVVHLGTVSPPRMAFMLEVARRAAERRRGLRWLFLGVSPSTIAWVRQTYDEAFLRRHIVLRERTSHVEALRLVQASRIGFSYHPLERRFLVAIPMKVFEYMLMDVPVVSTALPELTRTLEAGRDAVLVDGDDPAVYAAAIADLLGDPERAARLTAAAGARIRDELNWEASEGPKLIEAYEDVLAR